MGADEGVGVGGVPHNLNWICLKCQLGFVTNLQIYLLNKYFPSHQDLAGLLGELVESLALHLEGEEEEV